MEYTKGLEEKWNEFKRVNTRLAKGLDSNKKEKFAKRLYLTGFIDGTINMCRKQDSTQS